MLELTDAGPVVFWYTIYRKKDDKLLAIGPPRECARALGIKRKSIQQEIAHCKSGLESRLVVVSEDLRTGEMKTYGVEMEEQNEGDHFSGPEG